MGPIATSSRRRALLLFLLLAAVSSAASVRLGERRVGGRTEIKDVASNKEVQDLGRFSVAEYNRRFRRGSSSSLSFSRVVEGQRQVVSGIRYFLRVAAWEGRAGPRRSFDVVVVVKPWMKSRDLLFFAPSAN